LLIESLGLKPPSIPEGYNYDFINADALTGVLSVRNGKLVTPSEISYEVLVRDDSIAPGRGESQRL
jgi:hypothetical protein